MQGLNVFLFLFALLIAFQECRSQPIRTWSNKDCPRFPNKQVGYDKNIRVEYLDLPPHTKHVLYFEDAVELCKLCFDGVLTMKNETKYLADKPHWIGVQRAANKTEWLWMDGSPVGDWKQYADFFDQEHLQDGVSYGVLVVKFLKKVLWVALPKTDVCTSSKVTDEFRAAMYFEFDDCGYKSSEVIYATCQREMTPACHSWNYTERQCRWSKEFGAHNYVSHNFADHPDNNDKILCKRPDPQRSAFQCKEPDPKMCPVTEWTNWSDCDLYFCHELQETRRGETLTTRSREKIDETSCPQGNYYPHLFESKPCVIEGCDKLKRV